MSGEYLNQEETDELYAVSTLTRQQADTGDYGDTDFTNLNLGNLVLPQAIDCELQAYP